jgi:hypothetical protein
MCRFVPLGKLDTLPGIYLISRDSPYKKPVLCRLVPQQLHLSVVQKAGGAVLSRPTVWEMQGPAQVSAHGEAKPRGRPQDHGAGCFPDSFGHGFTVAEGGKFASTGGTGGVVSLVGKHQGGRSYTKKMIGRQEALGFPALRSGACTGEDTCATKAFA